MKQETRPVFVADDGKVFDKEADALAHEDHLLKRQRAFDGLRAFTVAHGFDETEGKGYFAHTIVVTDATNAVVIQWCLDKFGPPLSGWYGDGYYDAWVMSTQMQNVEWALNRKGHVDRYASRPWELVVISKSDFTWAGLPASEFPWPRKKPAQEGRVNVWQEENSHGNLHST